ncbi:MAG: histidine kinase [Coriobacteriia bacterium]|nr:histidine kinase [Coriobacteriia bacterium]
MIQEHFFAERRASQTKWLLSLASKTLEYMRGGLSQQNCQAVCELLLPETQAMAVAMTDDRVVLGYAGRFAEDFPLGSPIHTAATHEALSTQEAQVFSSTGATAATSGSPIIPAGIVAPLLVRNASLGTLKLYYEAPELIDETQMAISEGFAELLSTQLSMAELDRQVELATKAELQALQSQINPHFLFNTINTIAALIRTDPDRARVLLREFATFYRRTLENSDDLITVEREIEQTTRYLGFEVARFGESRIRQVVHVEPGLEIVRVPAFIIQPIIENSVNHAMRPEGPLTLTIDVHADGGDAVIAVSDDGLGMTQETAERLVHGECRASDRGTGIALHNVDARLHACFGGDSGMTIDTQLGVGTTVTMRIAGAVAELWGDDDDEDDGGDFEDA